MVAVKIEYRHIMGAGAGTLRNAASLLLEGDEGHVAVVAPNAHVASAAATINIDVADQHVVVSIVVQVPDDNVPAETIASGGEDETNEVGQRAGFGTIAGIERHLTYPLGDARCAQRDQCAPAYVRG